MPAASFLQIALTWLGLTLAQGPEISEDGQALWSGRLLASAGPSALYGSSRGVTLRGERAQWSRTGLIADGFGARACAEGKRAVLALNVRDETGHKLLTLVQVDSEAYAVREEVTLPQPPAGKPVPIPSADGCSFAVMLVDGTIRVLRQGALELLPQTNGKIADLRENPLGFSGCTTPKSRLVMVTPEGLWTWDLIEGNSEKVPVEGGVAGQIISADAEERVFFLDRSGALLTYRPFVSPPKEVLPSRGISPSGLSARKIGEKQVLLWATLAGQIVQFDGSEVSELAAFSSGIRMPLLSADVLDLGSQQIFAALEDGSLGVVFDSAEGLSAMHFDSLARAKGPPVIVSTSDTEAARWVVSSGPSHLRYVLGQPTAQAVARADASLSAGEVIVGMVSSAQTTTITVSIETQVTETQADTAVKDEGIVSGSLPEPSPPVAEAVGAMHLSSNKGSQSSTPEVALVGGGGCAVAGALGTTARGAVIVYALLMLAYRWRRNGRRS